MLLFVQDQSKILMDSEAPKETAGARRKVYFDYVEYSFVIVNVYPNFEFYKVIIYLLLSSFDEYLELFQVKFAPKAPPRRVPKPEVKTYVTFIETIIHVTRLNLTSL